MSTILVLITTILASVAIGFRRARSIAWVRTYRGVALLHTPGSRSTPGTPRSAVPVAFGPIAGPAAACACRAGSC